MRRVIIGMDPHKRSATIEVIDEREKVLAQGRFGTDTEGYQTMLKLGRTYPNRVWAVEGCNGIGRHIAQRLVADGETVLDVPAKLSARARMFATGQGRKNDPVDAHSVAVVALRTTGLRQVVIDDVTVALRLLVDRRDGLGRARTDTINRLHKLLLELIPGGAKQFLSAPQARTLFGAWQPFRGGWFRFSLSESVVRWCSGALPQTRPFLGDRVCSARSGAGGVPGTSGGGKGRASLCSVAARPLAAA
jgi:transposase